MKKSIKKLLQKSLTLIDQGDYSGILSREEVAKIPPSSLLSYYGNIHSQRGQDGILAEIFRRLHLERGMFVEFGAWDGMYLSNCRHLFEKGWSGVYIEGDKSRFEKLKKTYAGYDDIYTVNSFVGAPKHGFSGEKLSTILDKSQINLNDISFVSIDVDGADLEIFQEMGFKPPVVLVEGGFNFSPDLKKRIPDSIAWANLQQPLSVIIEAADELDYVPVCFYQDTYFVRKDLCAPFLSVNTGARSLYSDAFSFMPMDFRQYILAFRQKNAVIKQIESEYFGHFNADPLSYE